jgi:hypothetical protein
MELDFGSIRTSRFFSNHRSTDWWPLGFYPRKLFQLAVIGQL